MRHRVKTKSFNRDTNTRKALLRGLARNLVEHGEITTTREKAKEVRRIADKLINKAKTDTVANRRQIHRFFGKRDVVNTLVERIAPIMKKRVSGFTTLSVIGKRRGDNTTMVKLALVEKPEKLGTLKSGRDHSKKAKPATKKAPKKAAAETTKKVTAKKAAPKKSTKKTTKEVASKK